ncbi:hypothetical protein QBC35DRAFT_15809 [Podospora australis]|uniref:Uncharacterized protein n=1 Tax=Podospora australis TaxID=1536484 RepID=A0AAN6WQ89_9PEZI|nr:hypothetical protein QBC35DRAFT_15809 [Podospora australis]
MEYLDTSASSSPGSPILWVQALHANGCKRYPDDSDRNCTQACSDPELLFASLSTLSNYITLSMASLLIQNGTLSPAKPDPLSNDQAPASSTGLETLDRLSSFGVRDPTLLNGTHLMGTIVRCAVASCEQPRSTTCPQSLVRLKSLAVEPGSLDIIRQGLASICENIDINFNLDIAGPGVS